MDMLDLATALSESTVTWADLKWICKARSGPIIVTGIFVGDDARRAIDEGAAAVVVSTMENVSWIQHMLQCGHSGRL